MRMRAELLSKIIERRAVIGVIGLGYVGLPLAVEFGRGGMTVIGFDLDESRIETINGGRSYIPDVPTEMVQALVEREKLSATTDFSRLAETDAVIICVPTPLRKTKEPDISYILAASEQVKAYLHTPQLVVLESTTYPGTTDEVLLPMLQETGLALDKDFYVAFSPERVDPGNRQFQTNNIPKVVGGASAMSTEVAAALYQTIVERVHKVSSARVAETAKLLENTFRSVNIALVNEMAQLCYHLGIDSWEVIQAAATKPFGFMAFYPGPGIGGHCIPLDPHYLSWKARLHGFEARFISLAEEVNSRMPRHVVQLVQDGLNEQGKALKGSRVFVLGVAYKRDINDVRESPALGIVDQLLHKGAEVSYHDPFISEMNLDGKGSLSSVELTDEAIQSCDCAVIVTDHSKVDYSRVLKLAPLVVDTRNVTRKLGLPEHENKVVRL
ncbi:MAG TPA: nucleotide sugar dehydrogenase [Blastocatellia bacterium]|jgi:UDP-N-acetyl-D-glucosamine dehydrogenase|nr:nucleotide sugar dehydrogenase [Blastocatellia bacterium]